MNTFSWNHLARTLSSILNYQVGGKQSDLVLRSELPYFSRYKFPLNAVIKWDGDLVKYLPSEFGEEPEEPCIYIAKSSQEEKLTIQETVCKVIHYVPLNEDISKIENGFIIRIDYDFLKKMDKPQNFLLEIGQELYEPTFERGPVENISANKTGNLVLPFILTVRY